MKVYNIILVCLLVIILAVTGIILYISYSPAEHSDSSTSSAISKQNDYNLIKAQTSTAPSSSESSSSESSSSVSSSPYEELYADYVNDGIIFSFADEPFELKCAELRNHRLYLSCIEFSEVLNRKMNSSTPYNQVFGEMNELLSLYDICEMFDLQASLNDELSKVTFYETDKTETEYITGERAAYIRLEDIMADSPNGRKGYYDDAALEKTRFIAKYLSERGQNYYIALIPLYVNPVENIVNDITSDVSLYNADFVYTLDYIVNHGGVIGEHGYSHQQENTESSVGNEFGSDSPFSEEETRERMLKGRQIIEALGYECAFFEFPHYAYNAKSLETAEELYDVIYQQYPSASALGLIETVEKDGGRTVKYVPTPSDHVTSAYDVGNMINRIEGLGADKVISMFFHPRIDFIKIYPRFDGTTKYFVYDDTAFLPKLMKLAAQNGFALKLF